MVDKITKALKKLSKKQSSQIKTIFTKIKAEEFLDLDTKKLKGRADIYRIRKGNLRIIFQKTKGKTKILAIEKRSDTTYK